MNNLSLDSIPEDKSVDTFKSFVSKDESGVKKYHLSNDLIKENLKYIRKGMDELYNAQLKNNFTSEHPHRLLITFNKNGEVVAIEKKFVEKRYILSEIPEENYTLYFEGDKSPLYQYAIEPKIDGEYVLKSEICHPSAEPNVEVKRVFEKVLLKLNKN